MLVVLTTVPSNEEAEELAEKLINSKLAACVQVLPQMKSFYLWKGEVQKDSEYLLLIKTLDAKFSQLKKFIKKNHSYDVPEIVALPADRVSESYLKWIEDYLERAQTVVPSIGKAFEKKTYLTYSLIPLDCSRNLADEGVGVPKMTLLPTRASAFPK